MPQQAEDMLAVRREMLELLRRQMEVLNSGLELTDTQLRECFDRQGRVQDLRETLQAALNADAQHGSSLVESASVESASADLSGPPIGEGLFRVGSRPHDGTIAREPRQFVRRPIVISSGSRFQENSTK
jgi:hypothetical protein